MNLMPVLVLVAVPNCTPANFGYSIVQPLMMQSEMVPTEASKVIVQVAAREIDARAGRREPAVMDQSTGKAQVHTCTTSGGAAVEEHESQLWRKAARVFGLYP